MLTVRGSRGKQDHLIDLDFQYDSLLPTPASPTPPPATAAPGAPSSASGSDLEGGENKSGGGVWEGQVHRGMLKSARFILHTRGLRAMLARLPPDFKIRLVGHSLGAGGFERGFEGVSETDRQTERGRGGRWN